MCRFLRNQIVSLLYGSSYFPMVMLTCCILAHPILPAGAIIPKSPKYSTGYISTHRYKVNEEPESPEPSPTKDPSDGGNTGNPQPPNGEQLEAGPDAQKVFLTMMATNMNVHKESPPLEESLPLKAPIGTLVQHPPPNESSKQPSISNEGEALNEEATAALQRAKRKATLAQGVEQRTTLARRLQKRITIARGETNKPQQRTTPRKRRRPGSPSLPCRRQPTLTLGTMHVFSARQVQLTSSSWILQWYDRI